MTCIATYYASDVVSQFGAFNTPTWHDSKAELIARFCPCWCSMFEVEVDKIYLPDDFDGEYLADVAFHVWA